MDAQDDDVAAYACLIMNISMLENLGIALPSHAARESGIVETGMNEEERRIANMQVPKPNKTTIKRAIVHLEHEEVDAEESSMAYAICNATNCRMDILLLNHLKDSGNAKHVDRYHELLEDLMEERRKRQRNN